MTQNVPIYVFTEETLRQYDEETVTGAMQVIIKHVLDNVQEMNAAQILNASRHHGKSLYLRPDEVSDIVTFLRAKQTARVNAEKV